MAENKNAVLNDEMMADAAGGKRASGDKKFFVGDRVAWSWDNGMDSDIGKSIYFTPPSISF